MYQSKTLRRLPPTARRLARTANALELEVRRLHRMILLVSQHEQVYAHVTRPKAAPQAELVYPSCAAHTEFDPKCGDCAEAFWQRGVLSLEAGVSIKAPEVPSD